MKVGIIGSGDVGKAIGEGLLKSGHEVMLSTSKPEKLSEWLNGAGKGAKAGSHKDTASFGEMNFLCVKGTAIESAIEAAGKGNFSGKIVIDVTNPLVFEEEGKPPKNGIGFPDSNGKKVKALLPEAKVCKAFNTVTAKYMANPREVKEGDPTLFIAGDNEAKDRVQAIAEAWGWKDIIDIGGIEESYILEAMTILWVSYGFSSGKWAHAFKMLKE